ncbi:MAG: ATP-dependent helicase [Aeromicrobium sp.]|nr:ATP-dependent helicase [Aeromicrobium sp.]
MPSADDLLTGLDPEQREVAVALRGPVSVVAGAGTGKTRAITHRMAYGVATGVYKPTEVLAVTFTTKAANEMRVRLRDLGAQGVQARTFHSAALRQARYFWPHVYGGDFPEVTQSKFGMVAEAVRRLGRRADTPLLRDLSSEIEWAKVSNIAPTAYAAAAGPARREVAELDPSEVGNVLAAYEEIKRERGRIDMEDILLVTAAILADDERIAAQVRQQYRWFVVDEFQDVNPLQAKLLDLWLGGRNDICVVGDPRQTIYSFAGASPQILASFARKHEGAERIELVRNYRSTPQIVAAANAVFARTAGVAGADGVRLLSQQEPGNPVSYMGYSDELAEANAVASEISLLHRRGVPYREMAILFRINAQSEAFEEALGEHGIPYTMRGATGFFNRAEVRQAVTLLRGSARGEAAGGNLVDDVRAIFASMGHTDAPPSGAGAVRDRWESLHAIVSMATDLAEANAAADMTALVADLDRRIEQAHAPAADGVTLATLHSAKGLEWDAVFCIGMHEGMMPSIHADTPAMIEEERRLFYVGVTRARHDLMISWAATRKPGGRGNRQPTRFLDPLLPAAHEARKVSDAGRQRKVAKCRVCNTVLAVADRKLGRCADCPATYDEELYEVLRAWRKEQATEQGKPAYVIFTDATLQSIAEAKPADEMALAKVPGIGPAKIEQYAESVLELVGKSR